MNTVFTNISPITNAYTNFNHFFYLKNVLKVKKVFVCVWDNFVYEDPRFYKNLDSKTDKFQKLSENVALLEKLMKHLDLNYRIIYLSEAWERLFKKPQYSQIFQKILARITMEDLKEGFSLKYIPYSDITISRINYIVADYLIAANLHEIFPEITDTNPKYYLSSSRFKVFNDAITSILRENYGYLDIPELIAVKNVPVILDKKGFIPSLNTPLHDIKRIFEEYYSKKKVDEKEVQDFVNMLNNVLKDSFIMNNKNLTSEDLLSNLDYKNTVSAATVLAENLHLYFEKLKNLLSKKSVEKQSKTKYISIGEDFEKLLKLNPLKLQILKECNGENSRLDIARRTQLNRNTVSPYLTQLKNLGLISNEAKPRRLVNTFVIDLESIDVRGEGGKK